MENKPVYEAIPEFTEDEMNKAILENDIGKLIYVPLFASLYHENRNFAVKVCIKLAGHSHYNVRALAIEGIEHIARIDGMLNEEITKPIIEKALVDEDEFVRDNAESTKEATEQFLKWKYKK